MLRYYTDNAGRKWCENFEPELDPAAADKRLPAGAVVVFPDGSESGFGHADRGFPAGPDRDSRRASNVRAWYLAAGELVESWCKCLDMRDSGMGGYGPGSQWALWPWRLFGREDLGSTTLRRALVERFARGLLAELDDADHIREMGGHVPDGLPARLIAAADKLAGARRRDTSLDGLRGRGSDD